MAAAPPLLSLESGTERGHSCPLFYGTRTLFRSSMERGHSCPLFYGTRTLFRSSMERGHSCPLFYGTRTLLSALLWNADTLVRSSMERGHSCPLFDRRGSKRRVCTGSCVARQATAGPRCRHSSDQNRELQRLGSFVFARQLAAIWLSSTRNPPQLR